MIRDELPEHFINGNEDGYNYAWVDATNRQLEYVTGVNSSHLHGGQLVTWYHNTNSHVVVPFAVAQAAHANIYIAVIVSIEYEQARWDRQYVILDPNGNAAILSRITQCGGFAAWAMADCIIAWLSIACPVWLAYPSAAHIGTAAPKTYYDRLAAKLDYSNMILASRLNHFSLPIAGKGR